MPKKYLGGAEDAIDVEGFPDSGGPLGSVPFRAQKLVVTLQAWRPQLSREQASRSSRSSRTSQEFEASLGCVRPCL